MKKIEEQYDVAVIGGGPAGMMAAGRAAELGAKVALLEKNVTLGKKLLITGKGRCNITQAEFDDQKFVAKIGKSGKFLFSSLASFGPAEVIEFFEQRGLETKIERGGRVFPSSDKALDVLRALQDYLRQNNVTILFKKDVVSLDTKNGKIETVTFRDIESGHQTKKIAAQAVILATGGKSYPDTGSTGAGYDWARTLGHTITPPRPALVPITVKEEWIQDLQGLSLKNVSIGVFQNGKKKTSRFGEMIFTHLGISGPIVLDLSKEVDALLKKGSVFLELDLKPALDFVQLDKRLQRDFEKNHSKNFKNYLPDLVPQKLIPVIIKLSGIDSDKKAGFIAKEERKKLATLLKSLRMEAKYIQGYEHAIVTSGGIHLKEVDSKTMQSKVVPNLFFAGEVLDLDGPTGGYNLQISWTTGHAAGTHAVGKLET